MDDLLLPGRLVIPARELTFKASRASGPGGQHVNKVSSKVTLDFNFQASACLPHGVKLRLRAIAKAYLIGDDVIRISRQSHREQGRNLDEARAALTHLITRALAPPKRRRATRPTRASRQRRLDGKRRQAEKKASRKRVSGHRDD